MPDPNDPLSAHVNENIERVAAFHQRDQDRLTRFERILERVSRVLSRPLYLVAVLGLVLVWMGANWAAPRLGLAAFDPPPFALLQGLVTLASLATATIVLITQRRQEKAETRRSHLDLQVNLLTEQKVTKLIHLLEELRRDLPMVKDRYDAEAAALQTRTNAAQVLSALEEVGVGGELGPSAAAAGGAASASASAAGAPAAAPAPGDDASGARAASSPP